MIEWIRNHTQNIIVGLLFGFAGTSLDFIGYFLPIRGIIIVLFSAILFDLVLGVSVAISEKKGILPEKLWRTLIKILITFSLIHLMYGIDKEFGLYILHISTTNTVGLIIIGFEVWSIVGNAAKLTNHRAFRIIRKYMENRVKKETGIDLKDSNNEQDKIDK